MPTTITKGDIFAANLHAFAHGVNCAGAMDAGTSVAFKKRWPRMFEEYAARCADRRLQLGDVLPWSGDDATVYSLAIQQHWKKKATMPALSRALKRMVDLAGAAGIRRIGIPRIGAGLGGLDWNRVKNLLEKVGQETPIELLVFEQFIRAKGEGAEPTE